MRFRGVREVWGVWGAMRSFSPPILSHFMMRPSLSQIRGHFPILAILLLGAGLRFYGLDWGIASLRDFRVDGRELSIQEAGFHPDANFLTVAAQSLMRSIHPHHLVDGQMRLYSVFGPVFMYLFWIVGKILSALAGFDLFHLEGVRDANWTRLAGRSLSALAGTLTVLVTYLIGTRFYSRASGLAAASLLAVTPLHIQSSHFCTVDVLLGLWMAVAFLAFWRVVERGGRRDYALAGSMIGLGCATKLHAIELFIPLVVAHLIRKAGERQTASVRPEKRISRDTLHISRFTSYLSALWDRRLFLALGTSVATFALLAPSSVLRFRDYFDPTNMLAATNAILVNMGQVMMRGSFHFAGTPPYLYYLTNLFPVGMGVPLEMAVFAGIAWAVYRRQRTDLLLLSFVIFYFLATGRFQGKYIRYFVLWMPFVAVLSGRFLAELCGSGRKALRVAGIAFASIVGLYTSAYAAAFAGIYGQADVRVEAARWVASHVPAGSVVLLERGHNDLRVLLSGKDHRFPVLDIDDLLAARYQAESLREALFKGDYEVLSFGVEGTRRAVARVERLKGTDYYRSAFYDLYLRQADYVVISDDRLAMRGRLPFATMVYDALMDGGFGYMPVRQFTVTPSFLGIPFDDSGADVTWRQFDHPRVFVFQRTGEARTFDPGYRSMLPLQSAREAYETFVLAVTFKDIFLLGGCLLRNAREGVTPEELSIALYKLNQRVDLLQRLSEPRFAVQEADGWGIDLPRIGAEEAAKKQGNR